MKRFDIISYIRVSQKGLTGNLAYDTAKVNIGCSAIQRYLNLFYCSNCDLTFRLKSYEGRPFHFVATAVSQALRVRPTPMATKLQGLKPKPVASIMQLGDSDRPIYFTTDTNALGSTEPLG